MKSFFRNTWRKKDKPSSATPPTSPDFEKQDLTLSREKTICEAQSICTSPFAPAVATNKQDERTLRKRSKSASALGKHQHGPPANIRHGPPLNAVHGPPRTSFTHQPPPLSYSTHTLPKRPLRPPQPLYIPEPLSIEKRAPYDSPNSLPNVLTLSIIPPSPSKSTFNSACRGQSTTKMAKRPIPELAGVWREFLEDVEEDIDSLDFHLDISVHSSAAKSTRRGNFPSLPPTPPLKTFKISPPPTPKAVVRPTPIRASQSAPATISRIDSPTDAEFSLSLFPSPPPLNIRKRPSPRPLDLSRQDALYSSQTSLPSLSPAYSCSSPDLTPIATPTTPRFAHQQQQHVKRDMGAINHSISLPISSTPPTSPRRPNTPAATHEQEIPRKHLRNAYSSSHLRNLACSGLHKPQSFHRSSSSDTSSDHSISPLTAGKTHRDTAPHGDLNYLKSCGRMPAKHSSSQEIYKVQSGIAL